MEENTILQKFIRCCDMDTTPRTRLNAVWKIILKEFREYICLDAEARLEKWIGRNDFFSQSRCDMMKIDSPCFDMPTHLNEIFSSKATNKELLMGQGNAFLEMMDIPDYLHSDRSAKAVYLLLSYKKVSLRDNYIRSEYAALFKGCLSKIKLPYYSIFFKTFKQARKRFFEEPII
jgi:hypothetical protein